MSDEHIKFYAPAPDWRLTIGETLEFHLCGAPNWFHRLTQRIVLGFKWERV